MLNATAQLIVEILDHSQHLQNRLNDLIESGKLTPWDLPGKDFDALASALAQGKVLQSRFRAVRLDDE